jgi:hypothetical protein
MNDTTLPNQEYFTLQYATKLLGCEMQEILTQASHSSIFFSIYFNNIEIEILFPIRTSSDEYLLYKELIENNGRINSLTTMDILDINENYISNIDNIIFTATQKKEKSIYIKAHISGLWDIFGIYSLMEIKGKFDINKNNIKNLSITPFTRRDLFTPELKILSIQMDEITPDDLCIDREQLQYIINESRQANSTSTTTKIDKTSIPNTSEPNTLSESNALQREQILTAAIYLAFSNEYRDEFKEKCLKNRKKPIIKQWANLMERKKEELFLSSEELPTEETIEKYLQDTLKPLRFRTQKYNISFREHREILHISQHPKSLKK